MIIPGRYSAMWFCSSVASEHMPKCACQRRRQRWGRGQEMVHGKRCPAEWGVPVAGYHNNPQSRSIWSQGHLWCAIHIFTTRLHPIIDTLGCGILHFAESSWKETTTPAKPSSGLLNITREDTLEAVGFCGVQYESRSTVHGST
jgi:hypothetical protein